MRDKRMTEFTGRQMVIRLSPTGRVLVGKDVTQRWGWCCSHEMRVVLATMRGDGWQDYNTVAREETSLPAAIERLTNSTPISHMYGTRDSPITLAYAEGYMLRGGTL